MPVRCAATRMRSAALAVVAIKNDAVMAANVRYMHLGCLGLLPLPLGEGWGEGLGSIDRPGAPSPRPSPRRGEGVHRACGSLIASLTKLPCKLLSLIVSPFLSM